MDLLSLSKMDCHFHASLWRYRRYGHDKERYAHRVESTECTHGRTQRSFQARRTSNGFFASNRSNDLIDKHVRRFSMLELDSAIGFKDKGLPEAQILDFG